MSPLVNDLAAMAGVQWTDYQLAAFEWAETGQRPVPLRSCLYYKTGAGKSLTSLMQVKLAGHDEAVVICPPATYDSWEATAKRLGMAIECMSHAKFRMPATKLSRHTAVIVDEFHMLGGHGGKGWKKMDTMARHLQAPLVINSATPNYNDAERVYCIQHVLDPHSCKGGYLQFLYANCITEANPYKMEPEVTGFRNHKDAAHYLSSLPYVHYVKDDLVYTIEDILIGATWPTEAERYGYLPRERKMLGSQIEERHARVNYGLVGDDGRIRGSVYDLLTQVVGEATTPVLIYATHSTVAKALSLTLSDNGVKHALVTGESSTRAKAEMIQWFREGLYPVLVGTASLGTGTDGLDKVCDTLVILDDTDDDSARRQLIGRIMPRGVGGSSNTKRVIRFVLS